MAKPAIRADSPSLPLPPVREEKTGPLSRLRQCPPRTPNTNNKLLTLSLSLREQYASAAESIKNLLISDLTSRRKNSNIEAMVDLANNAFASLDWLHFDYSYLYAAVRAYISSHCKCSLAKEEQERKQNELSRLENLCARVNKAAEALNKADVELSNAMDRFCSPETSMAKTPVMLKKLLAENAQVQRKVDVLKEKHIAESFNVDDDLDNVLTMDRLRLKLFKGNKLSNQ